jgi:hypothetical protein
MKNLYFLRVVLPKISTTGIACGFAQMETCSEEVWIQSQCRVSRQGYLDSIYVLYTNMSLVLGISLKYWDIYLEQFSVEFRFKGQHDITPWYPPPPLMHKQNQFFNHKRVFPQGMVGKSLAMLHKIYIAK